jgi:hypothetical protein
LVATRVTVSPGRANDGNFHPFAATK